VHVSLSLHLLPSVQYAVSHWKLTHGITKSPPQLSLVSQSPYIIWSDSQALSVSVVVVVGDSHFPFVQVSTVEHVFPHLPQFSFVSSLSSQPLYWSQFAVPGEHVLQLPCQHHSEVLPHRSGVE